MLLEKEHKTNLKETIEKQIANYITENGKEPNFIFIDEEVMADYIANCMLGNVNLPERRNFRRLKWNSSMVKKELTVIASKDNEMKDLLLVGNVI